MLDGLNPKLIFRIATVLRYRLDNGGVRWAFQLRIESRSGIRALPRMMDKTQAYDEGTLGEYDADCPHDRPILDFIGVDFATSEKKSKNSTTIRPKLKHGCGHSSKSTAPMKSPRSTNHAGIGSPMNHSQQNFDAMKSLVAPNRKDVTTWFQILDLDEKRVA